VTDDERIEQAVTSELQAGLRLLETEGFPNGRIAVSRVDQFATTTIELSGRFAFADREVSACVEIDPGRKGWRIEAELWAYLDADEMQHLVRDLGAARVTSVEDAEAGARSLARAAWASLRDYLRTSGR
jgi:hypothetical protein